MLVDKDINGTMEPMVKVINEWYIGELSCARAAKVNDIANQLLELGQSANCFDNITQAFKMACQKATSDDLVLVFGSFFTVAEVRRLLTR